MAREKLLKVKFGGKKEKKSHVGIKIGFENELTSKKKNWHSEHYPF
jgi:hypothetical protein